MAERLVPCAACSRHLRCVELACPFCGAPVSTCSAPSSGEPFRRMAAAAAVAAGVASLTGCSSHSSAVAFYGGPGPVLLDDSGGGGDGGMDAETDGAEAG